MSFLLWALIIVVVNPGEVFAAPNEENKSGCVLPPSPRHGEYSIDNYDGPIIPGDLVDTFTVLSFSCIDEDYQLSLENPYSICTDNNSWSGLPECHKECDMPKSLTVDFECKGAKFETMKCTDKMPQGSHITSKCKDGHVSSEYLEEVTCREGTWDSSIPRCSPDCGLQKPSAASLLPGHSGEGDTVPWNIIIYEVNKENRTTHKCSGTLLTSNVIITTAHCLIDPVTKSTLRAEDFRVAAGKLHKEWDHSEETKFNYIQKSKVAEIIIFEHIGRQRGDLVGHLAVVIAATPFKLSDSVRPACFDLQNDKFYEIQTQEGTLGKVSRWGRKNKSEALSTISVPVVNLKKCQQDVLKKYESIVNDDKICAGDENGSDVCEPGAGLVFPATDVTLQTRWYLRGFVSARLFDYQRTEDCRKTYTVFTDLSSFKTRLFPLMQFLSKPRT